MDHPAEAIAELMRLYPVLDAYLAGLCLDASKISNPVVNDTK